MNTSSQEKHWQYQAHDMTTGKNADYAGKLKGEEKENCETEYWGPISSRTQQIVTLR